MKQLVTISDIAQRVLDENGYDTDDISLKNLEYNIDNAIDFINLMSGRSIAVLDGSEEAKTLTGTRDEILVVKTLSALLIRAHNDRGPNVSAGPLNVGAVLADPQYSLFSKIVWQGINRLRGRTFVRT